MADKHVYAKEEDILNEKYTTIGLNETVPEEALGSICKFELTPKTQIAVYPLFKDGYFKANGKYFGSEIPLITTEGDIVIYNSKGEIKTSFYVSDIINVNSVSDIVTESYIEKHWSDKFYISKNPVETTAIGNNTIYMFKFNEDDFINTGIPKKAIGEDVNFVSSAFFKIASSSIEGTKTFGASPSIGSFYYDSENNEWILKVRTVFPAGDTEGELFKAYSKVFIYYELNTPYTINNPHIISLAKGDYISFIPKINDIHLSLIEDKSIWTDRWDTPLTSINMTPGIQAKIPCSISSSLNSFDIIAKGINSSNNSIDVNNYNWIGDGDGTTDYTSLIQNKIDELNMFNGGIVYLGNGTYNISKSLMIYGNVSIIGTGDTIINQTSDKTHGIIINGSNINIENLTIKLSGNCDGTIEHVLSRDFDSEMIGCIYVNSSNIKTNADFDDRYPENLYCQHITIKDVTLAGTYGFKWEGSYQLYPENKNTYKGCGIVGGKMFFNYLFADNIRMKKLYCGYYGTGGSNIINLFCTDCKIMVYDLGGGYNNFDIKGHSSYGPASDTETTAISDMVVYSNGENNNYNVQVYDAQWFEYLLYFDGCSMNNKYNMHYMSGGYYSPTEEINPSHGRIKSFIYNIGRGNVNISPYVNEPFHTGSVRYNLSGQSEFKDTDTILYNLLAGAGIWGNISTTNSIDETRLSLANVCRYPNNDHLVGSYILFNETPSVENPIEIIIDVANRPAYAFPNIFIQFHHEYVASDFSITWYTSHDDEIRTANVKDNTNVVYFYNLNQTRYYNMHKIKIVITKALNIPELKYRNSDYVHYTKNYNENNKVGICNIGMVGDMFGRSFLGECGGSLYGELNLENNIITNLGTPIKNTDAANKKYVDDIAINSGAGDMLRSVYDTDGDGVVDNAMALNGLPASDYVTQSQLDNVDSANKVDKVEGYGLISLYDNIIEDTLYGTDLTVIGEDGNKTYAFIPRLLSDMVDDVGYATNEKVDDTNEKINEIYDILTYTAPALTATSPDGTMIGSDGWTGTGFMCTEEDTKYEVISSDMSSRIVGFNRFCLRFADVSGNKWKNWSPWLDIDGVTYEFFYSPARKLYEALIPATTKTAEEIVSSIRWERAEPDVIRYGKLSSMMGSYVTTSTGSDGSAISTTEYYPILNDEISIRDCSGAYNYYDAQFLFRAFMGSVEFDSSIDINLISKVWLRADLNCDGRCNNNDLIQIPEKIQTSTVFTVETIDNFA